MGNYFFCCLRSNQLENIEYNDVEYFSLNNMEMVAKVVDVYDGDTCTVIFNLSDKLVKFKCRCKGYDSPEMKPSKDLKNRDQIIIDANKSKNFFINQVTNIKIEEDVIYSKNDLKSKLLSNHKLIKIKTYEWDKYGRLLADFYNGSVNVNQLMIDKGYGYPYDGGTKRT